MDTGQRGAPALGGCWVPCLVSWHPIVGMKTLENRAQGPGSPGMKQGPPLPFDRPPGNPLGDRVPVQEKL